MQFWRTLSAALSALCLACVTSVSEAQICQEAVGSRLTPAAFDDVAAILERLPRLKDEFETTAEFEARQQSAAASLPGAFDVAVSFDTSEAVYDADRQLLSISSDAFADPIAVTWREAFDGVTYSSSDAPDLLYNLAVLVAQGETQTGTYQASNAFGTAVTVRQITRDLRVIFGGRAQYGETPFGRLSGRQRQFVWEYPIPATEARTLRDGLRGVVRLIPRAPYYSQSSETVVFPTISDPREVTQRVNLIAGVIQCVFITDADNQVLLSVGAERAEK
jgi:hypothetical protein